MGRETFVLGNGLVLSVLDSQSLGAGFGAWTEAYVYYHEKKCHVSNIDCYSEQTELTFGSGWLLG